MIHVGASRSTGGDTRPSLPKANPIARLPRCLRRRADEPRVARVAERAPSSTLLARVGDDLLAWLRAEAGSASPATSFFVEAVTPRRIGAFRARPTSAEGDAVTLRGAAERLQLAPWVRRCVSVPPNLYIDLKPDWLNALICEEIVEERRFGLPRAEPPVEGVSLAFCSPNANKPLHLGHARNMLLGTAIGNLLELTGARVYRSCCVSDYGVHIFKALTAYLRSGAVATPRSVNEKGDHFVGRFYAEFSSDPSMDHGPDSPERLGVLWSQGDPEVRMLTHRMTSWAEAGFDTTFVDWSVPFDHRFHETEEQVYIDRFVEEQLAKGTLEEDEVGRLVVDLGGDPPQIVPLIRSDGTALYMSHMVAAILQRMDRFGSSARTLMALTGEEQVVPFVQLEKILERFGYATGVELRHLTHGLVYAGRTQLSSRDGTDLTLDGVVEQLAEAYARNGMVDLAHLRARGALALYVLARPSDKPLHFFEEECLERGTRLLLDTASTLQATRHSAGGIAGYRRTREFSKRADRERFERWSVRLASYPLALDRAVRKLDPSLLVNYMAGLCREFVLLRGAADPGDGVPDHFAELFSSASGVVEHVLRTLNLDPDALSELDRDERPEAPPEGPRGPRCAEELRG